MDTGSDTSTFTEGIGDFAQLTPDAVLDHVEKAIGKRCNGLCRQLTSYINRVYEVDVDDGCRLIAKFYRPGRWSRAALQDEHDFLASLRQDELPVIVPLTGEDGNSLHTADGICYAIFPKRGGRALDEPSAAQWSEIGRLLARVHGVGARQVAQHRIYMQPDASTEDQIQYLLDEHLAETGLRDRFEMDVDRILDVIEPLFDEVERIRIHGDCHRQNMLWRPEEPLSLIDFDDMANGTAVQDMWMLLPGRLRDSLPEMGALLDGYETFREFNRAELRLIEPLRFMRMIHYLAWCGRQCGDGGFARLSPGWGTRPFWQAEIETIQRQHDEIVQALASSVVV